MTLKPKSTVRSELVLVESVTVERLALLSFDRSLPASAGLAE